MILTTAKNEDIDYLKALWNTAFDDGTKGYCDFAFTLCDIENIYILKVEEKIVSMLMAIEVFIKGEKGYYLYSACTDRNYRNKGYMKALIEFSYKDRIEKGDKFCITKPDNDTLFPFYEKVGFTKKTYLREFETVIKKNMWASAEFDILTSSRMKSMRKEKCEMAYADFSSKGYEKFAEYIYSFGGSTAENKNGYCIYYIENNKMFVRELFSKRTIHALELLEAIRERTGVERARISLNENSDLFLGEGVLRPYCLIRGIDEEVYANLMFD